MVTILGWLICAKVLASFLKTFCKPRIPLPLSRQQLQSNRALQSFLARPINHSHPSPTQAFQNLKLRKMLRQFFWRRAEAWASPPHPAASFENRSSSPSDNAGTNHPHSANSSRSHNVGRTFFLHSYPLIRKRLLLVTHFQLNAPSKISNSSWTSSSALTVRATSSRMTVRYRLRKR